MKVAEALQPVLQPQVPAPVSKDYTWEQSLRFFVIGCVRSWWTLLGPVARAFYIQAFKKHSVHWQDLGWMTLASVAIPSYNYYQSHKHLLKLPPFAQIPPEFGQAKMEHTERTIEPSPSGLGVKITEDKETHLETVSLPPAVKPPDPVQGPLN